MVARSEKIIQEYVQGVGERELGINPLTFKQVISGSNILPV